MKEKEIVLRKKARKFLEKQTLATQKRIISAINRIPLGDIVPISNRKPYKRLRVGKFRIVFDDKGNVIDIVDIDSRGDVYKRI